MGTQDHDINVYCIAHRHSNRFVAVGLPLPAQALAGGGRSTAANRAFARAKAKPKVRYAWGLGSWDQASIAHGSRSQSQLFVDELVRSLAEPSKDVKLIALKIVDV